MLSLIRLSPTLPAKRRGTENQMIQCRWSGWTRQLDHYLMILWAKGAKLGLQGRGKMGHTLATMEWRKNMSMASLNMLELDIQSICLFALSVFKTMRRKKSLKFMLTKSMKMLYITIFSAVVNCPAKRIMQSTSVLNIKIIAQVPFERLILYHVVRSFGLNAYGMNIFDLKESKERDTTRICHKWQNMVDRLFLMRVGISVWEDSGNVAEHWFR